MILPPALRKLLLSAHLTVSVGWIGAVLAYLALDVAVATSGEESTLRAAYASMELVASNVILPLSLAALATGVLLALGTRWGLFRHYWVVVSLLLTVAAVAVLWVELGTIRALAATAADPATTFDELRALPGTLPHSAGGLAILLLVQLLNVYKPAGLTRYGWRKQREETGAARA
ncbi:MAG TPA: DUF2269 domain-containing protein [Candidatus Thermoplasmatota archaeon]|nr:DUF2269 domain-containing protein [Candidatus Thermoplasmatota archaeon]